MRQTETIGSMRLSGPTSIRRNKALRQRSVWQGGSISISTRPSAEPFASQLPPWACTPIVPRVRCEDRAARRTKADAPRP